MSNNLNDICWIKPQDKTVAPEDVTLHSNSSCFHSRVRSVQLTKGEIKQLANRA